MGNSGENRKTIIVRKNRGENHANRVAIGNEIDFDVEREAGRLGKSFSVCDLGDQRIDLQESKDISSSRKEGDIVGKKKGDVPVDEET
ncbi:hypothetical protein COLO4_25251 [Corchorus olitorius]|uniref:Uncharacterized protein n=1 Tax=Corchorus olitorius TaxID=93759 RepID=A0A1R3I3S9_9ROSI|nr:hypothetical protein COLO4_25251 [Corchorus olitorius]